VSDTRTRILTATNELFRRRGYNGTALKDVTAAAGAPTGSLYHFFPGGKSELAAAAMVESGTTYRQLFEMMADEEHDPAEAVRSFFHGAADVLDDCDFIDVCPIGTVAGEIASTDEALRAAADQVFTSWIESAAARFRAAGLPETDAAALAGTVVAALQGGFLLARCHRDADRLRSIGDEMHRLVTARLSSG
jgi:AcrR family transcriptional regulator